MTTSRYGYQWTFNVYRDNGGAPGIVSKIAANQGVAFTMTLANVAEFMLNTGLAIIDTALACVGTVLRGSYTVAQTVLRREKNESKTLQAIPCFADVGNRLRAAAQNIAGLAVSTRLFFGGRVSALAMAENYCLKNKELDLKVEEKAFFEKHKKMIVTGLSVAAVAAVSYGAYTYGLPSITLPFWSTGSTMNTEENNEIQIENQNGGNTGNKEQNIVGGIPGNNTGEKDVDVEEKAESRWEKNVAPIIEKIFQVWEQTTIKAKPYIEEASTLAEPYLTSLRVSHNNNQKTYLIFGGATTLGSVYYVKKRLFG